MSIYGYTYAGFKLIDFNSDNWHDDEWYNWTLLDSMFQAQFGDVPLPVVGGTANAITLDFTPDRPLVNGLTVVFIPTASPTGAVTLAVDGQTPKPLVILGNPVVAGDFLAGEPVKAIYNGTVFNTVAPLKKFSQINIIAGPSGASATAVANDLVISHNDDAGISILTPNNKWGSIAFGDPENNVAGYVKYSHTNDFLYFGRNGADALILDNTGAYLPTGRFGMNVTGANDFVILESAPNVMRLGSSGASNGLTIDLTSGLVTIPGGLTVTGTLNAANITGNVNVGTATGILPLANGGTGADTAPNARNNLGLGTLATKNTVNNGDWSGAALTVANGGTGAVDAANARINLGVRLGVDVQAYDADLAAIAALATVPFGRGMLELANAAAAKTYIGAIAAPACVMAANTIDVRFDIGGGAFLLIQGGFGSLAANTLGTINFPQPYAVAPVCVVGGGDNNINNEGDIHSYGPATVSGVPIINSTDASGNYNWLAIGRM